MDLTTLDGGSTSIDADDVAALEDALTGDLLTPDSDGYDAERSLWNAMIDRRPALIAACRTAEDAAHAVRFAGRHGVLLSICGAGHNIAGNAVCEGGLMISFKGMKAVHVDAEARTVRVEPGATLADVDAATQEHALAIPTGINSTTGIAGLTLGGGFGWLSRKHGLTVDSLLSANVILADGSIVTASDSENAELFWGLRGGGGNFGVVTSFLFRAHDVGPEVLSGLIVHPFADAPQVLRAYRDFLLDAPDEVTVWTVMRKAPPLPFLPEEVHGTEVVVLASAARTTTSVPCLLFGRNGRRRSLPHDGPDRDLVGGVEEKVAISPEHLWGVSERMHDGPDTPPGPHRERGTGTR